MGKLWGQRDASVSVSAVAEADGIGVTGVSRLVLHKSDFHWVKHSGLTAYTPRHAVSKMGYLCEGHRVDEVSYIRLAQP